MEAFTNGLTEDCPSDSSCFPTVFPPLQQGRAQGQAVAQCSESPFGLVLCCCVVLLAPVLPYMATGHSWTTGHIHLLAPGPPVRAPREGLLPPPERADRPSPLPLPEPGDADRRVRSQGWGSHLGLPGWPTQPPFSSDALLAASFAPWGDGSLPQGSLGLPVNLNCFKTTTETLEEHT